MPGPVVSGGSSACARCGAAEPALAPLTGSLRWPAVFAMGFLHAGLWAGDLLSARLCASCRRKAGALSLAVTFGTLCAVIGGATILLGVARR